MRYISHPTIILTLCLISATQLAGDAYQTCLDQKSAARDTCFTVRDEVLAHDQQRTDARYADCQDPFKNTSWTQCRSAAYAACMPDDWPCITPKVNLCQTDALKACDQNHTDDTATNNAVYAEGRRQCQAVYDNDIHTCPAPCRVLCGTVCMDTATCPCNADYPICSLTSGGYLPTCSRECSPIVMDVFDKGFHFTDISKGVKFRVSPNGPRLQMSWPDQSARNGWLVLDRNGNGVIDDFSEMFGNMTPQPPSSNKNGYLALAVFDLPSNGGNGDGIIDNRDSVYQHLRIWVDDNHNGISEPNELYKLVDLGIISTSLKYWRSDYVDSNGNAFRFRSTIVDSGGRSKDQITYDVFPVVEAILPTSSHK